MEHGNESMEHFDEVVPLVELPELGIDENTIVFAGFGSGATMAHQMHIIYSTIIEGVGLIEGVPFF